MYYFNVEISIFTDISILKTKNQNQNEYPKPKPDNQSSRVSLLRV